MKNIPQVSEEVVQSGFTHRADFSWRDFFGVTIGAATDKAFTLAAVAAGDQLVAAHLHLTTPFKDASDAAFNDIALDFGDDGSGTRYFSGVQINENGTEVIDSYLDAGSDHIFTAAGSLIVNFNSMTAKDLTNVDIGKLYLEYTLLRHGAANPAKNPLD